MDDNTVSERIYEKGQIMKTNSLNNKTLNNALNTTILRLEHLMQKQHYHPVDALDVQTLRNMIKMTNTPQPTSAPIIKKPFFGSSTVSFTNMSQKKTKIGKKSPKPSPKKIAPKGKVTPTKQIMNAMNQLDFFNQFDNNPKIMRSYGSLMLCDWNQRSPKWTRKSHRL